MRAKALDNENQHVRFYAGIIILTLELPCSEWGAQNML